VAFALVAPMLVSGALGCAHRAVGGGGPLSEPARRFAAEASAVRTIAFEEDFIDARLVYRALPPHASERAPLRRKLLEYLLGPFERLDLADLRQHGSDVGANDEMDRILTSFREALELFAPQELWSPSGPQIRAPERALLKRGAEVVVALFSPRGADADVATALLVLETIEPHNKAWSQRFAELLPWIETGARLSLTGAGPRSALTVTDVLEHAAAAWSPPKVADRLAQSYFERQDKLTTLFRRPLGSAPSRAAMGDLLLEGETVQGTAISVAALYFRCGQVERADEALKKIAGKPGDDPELRQLVAAAARPRSTADDHLALARRFLPRLELLGGTSNDRLDLSAAHQVLVRATTLWPSQTEVLLLASRVARFMYSPFLALRYLEEAQPLLERSGAGREQQAELASELLEASLGKLRVRIDPEHMEPATREAEALRRRFAENRQRFGAERLRATDGDIDFVLARGLLGAGLVDRAETLLERVRQENEPPLEVAVELSKLAMKRGDPRRAIELLEQALEQHLAATPTQETVASVQMQAKLSYALGNAYELGGNLEEARKAWRVALRGWERLMVAHLRGKNLTASAEASMEVGRLYYVLGRQQEGVQKFLEAIEQNESRDQSYVDALAFLVQRGDVEAALDVYRRAISKPSRMVSEYHKLYFSLWILDISRRSGRGSEPSAEAFLRSLDARRVHLRPQRVTGWYLQLARYGLGRVSYEDLLPRADTAGKRAELYFYEAMRRLADGRSDDAHLLWNKVIETRMFEFLEYDMAARYLRTGAPTRARSEVSDAETI
jgi:tetratricopeptide (TPR) repeat protein